MRFFHRSRDTLLLALIVLACTAGTFDCHSGSDDGDKIDVHGKVHN